MTTGSTGHQLRANGTPVLALCQHDTRTAARLPGDTVASVWECDECGDQAPFTDADYAFANAQPWSPFNLAVKLAHTVHARDHRVDTRCPMCRIFGSVAVAS